MIVLLLIYLPRFHGQSVLLINALLSSPRCLDGCNASRLFKVSIPQTPFCSAFSLKKRHRWKIHEQYREKKIQVKKLQKFLRSTIEKQIM